MELFGDDEDRNERLTELVGGCEMRNPPLALNDWIKIQKEATEIWWQEAIIWSKARRDPKMGFERKRQIQTILGHAAQNCDEISRRIVALKYELGLLK